MAKKEKLKTILIINKFGPNDKDITGKSAYDLGSFLSKQGCLVKYLAVKSIGKNNSLPNAVSTDVRTIRVSALKFGKSAPGLLLSSIGEGFLLFLKSCFIKKDVAIVMTAPPMLNFWGIVLKKISRCKVVFWTMDLYPDAFVSNRLVAPSNRWFKILSRFVYCNPLHAFIVLGHQQLAYLSQKYNQSIKAFVLPCGIQHIFRETAPPAWISPEDMDKLKFCYAGNVGEAHDEQFLIAFAKCLQPDKHILYINLYGNKARQVLPLIEHLPAIKKINYLSYGQMHFMDVHLASLLTRWDHVCVPSKAVSAICAGAVLLLNTSKLCDGWNMFKDASWLVEQKPGNYEPDIHIFLTEISKEQIAIKKQNALTLAAGLQQQQQNAYNTFAGWINQDI